MTKRLLTILAVCALLCSCAQEYNKVYKTNDNVYKYEYAKECFLKGQYQRATSLLESLITFYKSTGSAEECLYMYAMSQYLDGDYEGASMAFRKYFSTYPKGRFAQLASYNIGQSLYMNTPEPRLDQTDTYAAISAYQNFMDYYPDAEMKEMAMDRLIELQDKLVLKELYSAQLYYNLGTYFGNCFDGGNNYEACIITAQNALKDYPYNTRREDFAVLIMKSKYELAVMSVEHLQLDRYQDAEDEAYGFINEYPDSKEKATAEKFIKNCQSFIKKHTPSAN